MSPGSVLVRSEPWGCSPDTRRAEMLTAGTPGTALPTCTPAGASWHLDKTSVLETRLS